MRALQLGVVSGEAPVPQPAASTVFRVRRRVEGVPNYRRKVLPSSVCFAATFSRRREKDAD